MASVRGETGKGDRGIRGDVGWEVDVPGCCLGEAAAEAAGDAVGKDSAAHCRSCVIRSKHPASWADCRFSLLPRIAAATC